MSLSKTNYTKLPMQRYKRFPTGSRESNSNLLAPQLMQINMNKTLTPHKVLLTTVLTLGNGERSVMYESPYLLGKRRTLSIIKAQGVLRVYETSIVLPSGLLHESAFLISIPMSFQYNGLWKSLFEKFLQMFCNSDYSD